MCIRRLVDWTKVGNFTVTSVDQMFFFQAPSSKFWSKIAKHQTFEECIERLIKDQSF